MWVEEVMRKMGANDVRRVVWAVIVFLYIFLCVS